MRILSLVSVFAVSFPLCHLARAETAAAGGKAPGWEVGFEGANIVVAKDGGAYLSLVLRCWGPEWKWFSIEGKEVVDAAGVRVYAGSSKIPGTDAVMSMRQKMSLAGADTVAVDITLTVNKPCSLTGIALAALPSKAEFQGDSLKLCGNDEKMVASRPGRGVVPDSESFSAFIFKDKSGKDLAMRFGRAIAASSDGELRISLAQGALSPDKPVEVSFKLVIPGAVKFHAKEADALKRTDTSGWFPYPVGSTGTPVDLSFLNKDSKGEFIPAGAHGFLKVKGDNFVFDDGTPGRFWGVNVTAGAVLKGAPERHEQLAERLARLGVNVVRLHHLDTPWVGKTLWEMNSNDGTSQHMDDAALEKLDSLFAELKKRGIYIILCPWVAREFRQNDGVKDFDKLEKGNFVLHPYVFFDPRMQELVLDYLRKVWTHVNPQTKLAYKDDPACIITECVNEGLFRGAQGVTLPFYVGEFKKLCEEWAAANSRSPAMVDNIITQNYGDDNMDFFIHVMDSFGKRMESGFRGFGLKIPTCRNNWYAWTWELVPQVAGDYMDIHHYYGGEGFGAGSGLGDSWTVHSPYVIEGPWGKIAGAAIAGKPLTVSECGHNPPQTYRSAYYPAFAAIACLQGWDSITGYAYSQSAGPWEDFNSWDTGAYEWEADPATIASFAAGALIYRGQCVKPAEETAVITLPQSEIHNLRWQDDGKLKHYNLPEFNAMVETMKTVVCLGDEPPKGLKPAKEMTVESAAEYTQKGTELKSCTGEMWRDWAKGIGWIDTPKSQSCYGYFRNAAKPVKTSSCEFSIDTPFATLSLSSLDALPIGNSKHLLLTAVARVEATGMCFSMNQDKVISRGRAPMLAEPVVGSVSFKTGAKSLAAAPVMADGSKGATVKLAIANGTATVKLTAASQTLFYEITSE
jgi:hypothetical protein